MLKKNIKHLFVIAGVLLLSFSENLKAQNWNPMHSITSPTNVYYYNSTQTPANLLELYSPIVGAGACPLAGYTYLWEKSYLPLSGFTPIAGATSCSLTFNAPLTQTTYFRRKVIETSSGNFTYSNTIRLELVTKDWEDYNYSRIYTVNKPGITDWFGVDNLPIGADNKFEITNYKDGLGRSVQRVSKEMASPTDGSNNYGDIISFNEYDQFGRRKRNYLPYADATSTGKFKSGVIAALETYYQTNFNETSPFNEITEYDNSPLNDVLTVKSSGTSWAASNGSKKLAEFNTYGDHVKTWRITDYLNKYSVPTYIGEYNSNELLKYTSIDVNNKKTIEYVNKSGQTVLKKVQIDNNPSNAYNGWSCTYYIYDDFGRLHCTIEPEAVNYCDVNYNWDFTLNPDILTGYCFFYNYDKKGRLIGKRIPGADEMIMLYDSRNRLVLTQDGNQRNKYTTPYKEWTAVLYDYLDRPVISTLYKTTKDITTLQQDIDNAPLATSIITTTNAGQSIVDLIVDKRQSVITQYVASNSVQLVSTSSTEFVSNPGDEFVLETNGTPTEPSSTNTSSTFLNPITQTDLNNAAVCTILKYNYYDNYNFTGVEGFDVNFNNTLAYTTNGTTIKAITKTNRTLGFPTGSRTRVLNSNTFINTTTYYNDDGQTVQILETNIKNGKDVNTFQYHFNGKMLSVSNKHTALGCGYTNYETITKNIYDKIGRPIAVEKKIGNNPFINISSAEYNDLGSVKNKKLLSSYNSGNGLEKLNYDYNLHGQLTGINKDYALKTGTFNKWSHYFGMYLGYDNSDNVFTVGNLNGQIAGNLWTTQGDDAQRKFEYTYDNAGRLAQALYTEKQTPEDNWENDKMNFSTGGGLYGSLGDIEYDLNGNILSMAQYGVKIGDYYATVIDRLEYTYKDYSNQLKKINDNSGFTVNGSLGDFKTASTSSATDYDYDHNGNTVMDRNKSVLPNGTNNGIKYNFLDKPEEVKITGKGIVKYVYDADGTKLQKIFTADGSSTSTITTYINQYTYQETKSITSTTQVVINSDATLQSINFEEGKIRVITPISQANTFDALQVDGSLTLEDGKKGVLDFYIKDHLSNVRMVLTDETHTSTGTCSMNDDRIATEQTVFSGLNPLVDISNIPGQPWGTSMGDKAIKLNSTTTMVGAATLQKVMAGDELNLRVDYYYQPGGTSDKSPNLINNIINNLILTIGGSTTLSSSVKGAATSITNNLNTIGTGFIPYSTASSQNPATPRGFLNVLFFDERFNFVKESSHSEPVNATNKGQIVLPYVQVPKNGYVYIYLSNESTQPVYFDNLKINHTRGRITDESHYYTHGLKIASLSSKKVSGLFDGSLNNKEGYQGDYSDFEEELGWNDFDLRTYDPQIGRWLQPDPYDEFSSPYVGMGNDPANLADPTGGWIFGGIVDAAKELFSSGCKIATGVTTASTINVYLSLAVQGTNQYAATQVGNNKKDFINNALENVKQVVIPEPSEMAKKIVKAAKDLVNETPDRKNAYSDRNEQKRDREDKDDDPMTGNSKKARSKMNCTEFVERVLEKAGISKDKDGKPKVDDTGSLDGLVRKLRKNKKEWQEIGQPNIGDIWILQNYTIDSKGNMGRADHAGIVVDVKVIDGHLKFWVAHAQGKERGVLVDSKEYDWPSERASNIGGLHFFSNKN